MTVLTNLIEKVNSRLNEELLFDSYKQKKKYFKINLFSALFFAGSAYGMYTMNESSGMGFIYCFCMLLSFLSLLINSDNYSEHHKKYKMVIKNKVGDLNYEHSRKELNSEEINDLFHLELPDYALEQLYIKINGGWGIRYCDLRDMDLLLVRGEEHYINEKIEKEKTTRLQFKNFISKNHLNDHSSKTANRIWALGMKDKQHTKTFNSKKVL